VQLCDTYKKIIGNKPPIDTYLIMDDIIEKLSLLDYENLFCKGYRRFATYYRGGASFCILSRPAG